MMWNISFKTYKKDEVQEVGFETLVKDSIEDVIPELDSLFDLVDIDKVELQINPITLKQ